MISQFKEIEQYEPGHKRRVQCRVCGFVTAPTGSRIDRVHCNHLRGGLGDTFKFLLDSYGLSWLIRRARGGKTCGCERRRRKLNVATWILLARLFGKAK